MTSTTEMQAGGESRPKTWRRRGLFAAAVALVGGVVARVTEQSLEAGTDGDVILGANNNESTATQIQNTAADSVALAASAMAGSNSAGVYAVGSGQGVYGVCTSTTQGNGAGVLGIAMNSAAYAVEGIDETNAASGVGVLGTSLSGMGVVGITTNGVGVSGVIPSSSSANTIAITARNSSSYAGPAPGTGGFGVFGTSAKGHGLVGSSVSSGAAGVVGLSNGVAGAWAAIMFGPMIVEGDFTVIGGAKSAAVPHPDGKHRRLYCIESPESWFEDFGKARLECGQASVTLDPDFAAMVNLDDYYVFLTACDDFDLRVSGQTAEGFTVRAKDATASGRFSWRVVAKRKDIASPRFETVDVPAKLMMPTVPESVVPPAPPDRRPGIQRRG